MSTHLVPFSEQIVRQIWDVFTADKLGLSSINPLGQTATTTNESTVHYENSISDYESEAYDTICLSR
jgi:succinyl-CoA synthetase beta subunit